MKIQQYAKKISKRPYAYIFIFAIVGAIIIGTQAATYSKSIEPEEGDISGSVSILPDDSASGGRAITFASTAGPTGWPRPGSFKVCGVPSILNGPTVAPAGAVTVTPSMNLADATAAAPSGTTFYLTAGTHTLTNSPVMVKSNNKYIGAPGAILDGQFKDNTITGTSTKQSMAFRSGASGVVIQYLTIKNFGQADGKKVSMVNSTAINWSQGKNWTVTNNTIANNGGAGIWVTSGSTLRSNCLEGNEQSGFNVPSAGDTAPQATNILVENNEIRQNNRSNAIENVGVCGGCAGGLKVWNAKNVIIRNNNVSNNNGSGIWIDNNNIDILVEGNVVSDNTKRGIFYEISYSGKIQKNYISGNYAQAKGSSQNNTAIYISESGGDQATSNYLGSDQSKFPVELDISNNYVVDNWNGISLWEDANRHCSEWIKDSPNNKNDTAWCPPLITNDVEQCKTNLTANADLCRWKTKNVKVHNNKFELTSAGAAAMGCQAGNTGCSKVAIVASTNGTGPYSGNVIQTAISRNQNNKFYDNVYIGNWNFVIPGSNVSKSDWQTTWGQDTNSQFR